MPVSDELRDVGPYWYEIVNDDSIRQGDIFRNLLAVWLPDDLPIPDVGHEAETLAGTRLKFERADWIVLSASCDVQPGRPTRSQPVLLGRVYPFTAENLNNVRSDKDLRERIEVFRRGLDPMRYLLAEHRTAPEFPLSFAVFRLQLTMPLQYVQRCAVGPRLRIKSPHRERFGNWAGECLSRVGIEDAEQVRFERDSGLYPAQVLRAVPDDPL